MSLSTPRYSLAPMARYTDGAFRILCKEYGCQYTTTEFVSAEAVIRGNPETFLMAKIYPQERPAAVQIFGSEPKQMAKAAQILENDADAIDMNFGCPAPKITSICGGAGLLDHPEKIKSILEETVSTCKKPITAKMRLGIKSKENALKIAKLIEKCGVARLTVHGRTLSDGYSGKADREAIASIKKETAIPIIGNGDVKSWADAKAMFEQTNVDGIAIGRAALGNPMIFQNLLYENDLAPSLEGRLAAFMRYIKLRDELGMRFSLSDIKAHGIQFLQNFKDATVYRLRLTQVKNMEELLFVIQSAQ